MQGGPNGSAQGLAGYSLAVIGGGLTGAGVLLPWIEITYPLPHGRGSYMRTGWQVADGRVALGAGVLIAALGLIMMRVVSSRKPGGLSLGALAVVGGVVVANWWIRTANTGVGPGSGTAVSAAGVLIALLAAVVVIPGARRQRVMLLTAMVIAGAFGIIGTLLVGSTVVPAF